MLLLFLPLEMDVGPEAVLVDVLGVRAPSSLPSWLGCLA